MEVAGGPDCLPEIGFNTLSQGQLSRDMERAYVRGPGGPNAIPSVMPEEAASQSAAEVFRLADVAGVPRPVGGLFAEDVDAGPLVIVRPDGAEMEFVLATGSAGPVNNVSQA